VVPLSVVFVSERWSVEQNQGVGAETLVIELRGTCIPPTRTTAPSEPGEALATTPVPVAPPPPQAEAAPPPAPQPEVRRSGIFGWSLEVKRPDE